MTLKRQNEIKQSTEPTETTITVRPAVESGAGASVASATWAKSNQSIFITNRYSCPVPTFFLRALDSVPHVPIVGRQSGS